MNPLLTTGLDPHRGATALSVNVNKVALLRNTRELGIPSVLRAATLCLEAGAHGITVHPRPDQRHIRTSDVHELAALLRRWPQAEYNIEGNPFHNLMDFVRALRPQQCTFVPDSVEQATSDHGWQFPQDAERLAPVIDEARALGVRVSLFMDPLPGAMAAVRALRADRVELYTERYARAFGGPQAAAVLAEFTATAQAALAQGLGINAGHDLNRDNLAPFLAAVPGVQEVSIGHALVADALELGYTETVARLPSVHPPRRGRMIFGVGTDLCDVRRIAATLERRGERFAERVLGPNELLVFRARRAKVEARGVSYLATRFSAKEAFSKAIGLGMRMPMTWRDCEIVNAPGGKPQIRLHGALADWFANQRLRAHVSLSDEADYASSFVVVETIPETE